MKTRGYSLMEVVTATALGTALTVGGLVMTANFNRFSHRHVGELEVQQRLRRMMDLIAEDLHNAGVGVGYTTNGEFSGLMTGGFTLSGGGAFQANDRALTTTDGIIYTDDIGLRRALGTRRTVAFLESGVGQICRGMRLQADDRVSVTSRSGRSARTLRILSSSDAACTRGQCVGGCTEITYAPDSAYLSDAGAMTQRFVSGDLFAEYETVVWFLALDGEGFPTLRRVAGKDIETCAAADTTCGGEVAEGVEFLQTALWRLDSTTHEWVTVSADQPIRTYERLKVDLELVARTRGDPGIGHSVVIRSEINPSLCAPANCGENEAKNTTVPRIALRTSIEVKNSGYLRMQ